MDIIIEDNILYRFKKKWVNRYCKLVRTNNFSDSVKLLVYTYDENKNRRTHQMTRKSYQLISKHVIYGHLHGIHMHGEANVMFIVCKNSVECLAFREFNIMKVWSDLLSKHLNDLSQPVTLIYADKYSQLKPKLDGRLLINCSHISFIRDPSCPEPKLLMSWKIADIMEYGCSKDIKRNSSKSKLKNASIDLSQNIFIIKASPLCYQAPNNHIFSCPIPKQFCDRLENISLNQENFHSPCEYDLVMQRSRIDSYNTMGSHFRNREWSNSDVECSPESPTSGPYKFFPESVQSRVPRFQRSISEAPRRRSRIDSSNSIEEGKELDLNDYNVSQMCKTSNDKAGSSVESQPRCATVTWLERYPYEREPSMSPHRRLISEQNHDAYRTLNNNMWIIDRPFGPKSSSNYCSLMNLRPKSKMSLELSPPPANNPDDSSQIPKELFPLHLDKSQGLISRRSMKLTDINIPSPIIERPIPGYVNLEFTHIFEQINQLCTPIIESDNSQKTSGTHS